MLRYGDLATDGYGPWGSGQSKSDYVKQEIPGQFVKVNKGDSPRVNFKGDSPRVTQVDSPPF